MFEGYRKCSYCGEKIKLGAVRCRFCGERQLKNKKGNTSTVFYTFIKVIFYIFIIFLVISLIGVYVVYNAVPEHTVNEEKLLENYYCRGVGNLQWNTTLKVNKLFESDDAWGGGYSASEWQKKRNDINIMYNNCITYKTNIKNDIEKYGYLLDSLDLDENALAYCIGERKYLRSFNEPESNQYDWAVKFTPSITIKDDSSISSSIASCNEELKKNTMLLTRNMWQ